MEAMEMEEKKMPAKKILKMSEPGLAG